MARKRAQRPRRRERGRGLAVGEGPVTERDYVERLKQHLPRDSSSVTVKVVGSGEDPLRALSLAKRLREEAARQGEPYDWVCLLLDVDDHATLPRCLIEAKRSGVHVVVSNPQFELWLVWHIADHTAWVEGKKISRRASGLKLVEGKHLDAKFPIHGYEDAVVRARQADQGMADARQGPNPSSSMPLLVALMQGGAP